jgi:hypothetical protein
VDEGGKASAKDFVEINNDVDKEWHLLTGDCNLADLGTRLIPKPRDLVVGSDHRMRKLESN